MSTELKSQMRGHYHVMVRQSVLNLVFRLSGFGLGFVITYVMARHFGPDAYGQSRVALSLLSLVLPFTVLGLGPSLVKFIPQYRVQRNEAAQGAVIRAAYRYGLAASLLVAAALFLLQRVLAERIFHDPALAPVFGVAAVAVPFMTWLRISGGLFTAYQLTHVPLLHGELTVRLTVLAGLVMLLAAGWTTGAGILSAHALAHAFALGWVLLATRRLALPAAGGATADTAAARRDLMRFSFTMLFSAISVSALGTTDTLMIGYYLDARQVGLYNVADRLTDLSNIFIISVSAIYAGVASELFAGRRLLELRKVSQAVAKWMFTALLPLLATFLVFPRALVTVFGPEYADSAVCLVVIGLGLLVRCGTLATGPLLLGLCGHERAVVVNNAITLLLNIGLNAWWIPRHGIAGAAWATTLTRAVMGVVWLVETRRRLGLWPLARHHGWLLLNAALAAGLALAGRAVADHWLAAVVTFGLSLGLGVLLSLHTGAGLPESLVRQLPPWVRRLLGSPGT